MSVLMEDESSCFRLGSCLLGLFLVYNPFTILVIRTDGGYLGRVDGTVVLRGCVMKDIEVDLGNVFQ
jgi:hypothetical protein